MHACAERHGVPPPSVHRCSRPAPVLQIGVVSKGQPFIFFVRGRTVLRLKVAAAEPASLVRLVPGAEVAVAPRPRVARQAHRAGPLVPAAAHGEDPQGEEVPEIWLRVQVRDPGAVSEHVLMMWDISSHRGSLSSSGLVVEGLPVATVRPIDQPMSKDLHLF